ncbi:MAG: hypothetical protein ABI824_16875 [Acidobacteriota bacterium]
MSKILVDSNIVLDVLLEREPHLKHGASIWGITAAAAHVAGCNPIVTRDAKGFRGSPVRHLSPQSALLLLHTSANGYDRATSDSPLSAPVT